MKDVKILSRELSGNKGTEVGEIIIFQAYTNSDPVSMLDKAIEEYADGRPYKEFIDMNMDNPWMRIIILDIKPDDLDFSSYPTNQIEYIKRRKRRFGDIPKDTLFSLDRNKEGELFKIGALDGFNTSIVGKSGYWHLSDDTVVYVNKHYLQDIEPMNKQKAFQYLLQSDKVKFVPHPTFDISNYHNDVTSKNVCMITQKIGAYEDVIKIIDNSICTFVLGESAETGTIDRVFIEDNGKISFRHFII